MNVNVDERNRRRSESLKTALAESNSISTDSKESRSVMIAVSNSSKSTPKPYDGDVRIGVIPIHDARMGSARLADDDVTDVDAGVGAVTDGPDGSAAERRALVVALGASLGRVGRARRRRVGLVFCGLACWARRRC